MTLKNYQGADLVPQDYQAMMDLERVTYKGPIPHKIEMTRDSPEPGFVSENHRVVELCVSNLAYRTPPKSIGKLSELRYLCMEYSPLEKLPSTFGNLKNLVHINLNRGIFCTVPEPIFEMISLTTLCLRHNQLNEIPKGIAKLPNLVAIRVSDNNLTTLPSFIGNMPNLNSIDLRGNPLRELPLSILNLPEEARILLSAGKPTLHPRKYQHHHDRVLRYYRKLAAWSPAQVVEKIRNNTPLSEFDTLNHKLGPSLHRILEEVKDVDTQVKRDFEEFAREKFSARLKSSNLKVLL